MLTPLELYTCLLVSCLVNQRPKGLTPNDLDDGSYLCPNDLLLGGASSQVPQRHFKDTRNPRRRVEFVQRVVNSLWKRWSRDVFPSLIVTVKDPNAVRGRWNVGPIVDVYPAQDGKVRNFKVKTLVWQWRRTVVYFLLRDCVNVRVRNLHSMQVTLEVINYTLFIYDRWICFFHIQFLFNFSAGKNTLDGGVYL